MSCQRAVSMFATAMTSATVFVPNTFWLPQSTSLQPAAHRHECGTQEVFETKTVVEPTDKHVRIRHQIRVCNKQIMNNITKNPKLQNFPNFQKLQKMNYTIYTNYKIQI